MPELREIGLDPAVQGVPFKKKPSVSLKYKTHLSFFGWEDYVPELREKGLDPAVQGVPVKKKNRVLEPVKVKKKLSGI